MAGSRLAREPAISAAEGRITTDAEPEDEKSQHLQGKPPLPNVVVHSLRLDRYSHHLRRAVRPRQNESLVRLPEAIRCGNLALFSPSL
jgi:hypothetical protein